MEQGLPGQPHRNLVFFLRHQQAAALLPHLVSEDRQPFANRHPAFSSAQRYRQARYLPGTNERIQAQPTEQGPPSQAHKPGFFLQRQQAAALLPRLVFTEDRQRFASRRPDFPSVQ